MRVSLQKLKMSPRRLTYKNATKKISFEQKLVVESSKMIERRKEV